MSEVPVQNSGNDRSLGDLFGDLAREMSTLVRQELQLAKAEMSQKAADVTKNVGIIIVGGALAYAGLLALLAAVIILLGGVMDNMWLAALIVGLVVAGIGGALAYKGVGALKQADLTPRQTLETLKEDAQWAREQTRQRG